MRREAEGGTAGAGETTAVDLIRAESEIERLRGEITRIAQQKRILALSYRASLAALGEGRRREPDRMVEPGPDPVAFAALYADNRRLEDELDRARQRFEQTRLAVERLLRRFGFRLLPRRIRVAVRARLFGAS